MQRGLMALADVEGARIHLRRLTISHQLASLESIREILIIHYTRQLLHEMYKVRYFILCEIQFYFTVSLKSDIFFFFRFSALLV